jgi:hypothetical protein
MNKKIYTKPLLKIEEMKLQSLVALSFDEGTTYKMESKSIYFDYEENQEDNE